MCAAQRRRLGDRLQRPGLVVGEHQADQGGRPLRQQAVECCEIGHSGAIDRQHGRVRRGGADRVMFGRTDDHAPAGAEPVDGERVSFGATRGEHEIGRATAEPGRDRLSCVLQQLACGAARPVHRGRVALSAECVEHRRPGLWAQHLRGVGVQIGHRPTPGIGSSRGRRRRFTKPNSRLQKPHSVTDRGSASPQNGTRLALRKNMKAMRQFRYESPDGELIVHTEELAGRFQERAGPNKQVEEPFGQHPIPSGRLVFTPSPVKKSRGRLKRGIAHLMCRI